MWIAGSPGECSDYKNETQNGERMTRSGGMKIAAKPALPSVERTNLFPDRTNDLIEWVSVNSGRLTSWHCAQGAAKKRIEARQAVEPGIPAAFDREKCEGKLFKKRFECPAETNIKRRSHHEQVPEIAIETFGRIEEEQ